MGLFGSDDNDEVSEEVQQLVNEARHKSVKIDRLTKLKPGRMSRYLEDKPLIEYLKNDEQPHFILAARQKSPSAEGTSYDLPEQSGSGMIMHMITDERWLVVSSNTDGDQTFEIPLSELKEVDYSTGGMSHEIELYADDGAVSVPISNSYNKDEIKAAHSYLEEYTLDQNKAWISEGQTLREILEQVITILTEEEGQFVNISFMYGGMDETHYQINHDIHALMNLSDDGFSIASDILNRRNVEITRKNKDLKDLHFRIKDNTIDQGSRIAETLLEEVYSVDESDISHIGIAGMSDTEFKNRYLQIKEKETVTSQNIEHKESSNEPQQTQDTTETTDVSQKLKELKSLHESGILTDSEFESKKEQLIEDL